MLPMEVNLMYMLFCLLKQFIWLYKYIRTQGVFFLNASVYNIKPVLFSFPFF